MCKWSKTTTVADRVLREMKRQGKTAHQFTVEPFKNGRERGWCVMRDFEVWGPSNYVGWNTVAFAENRNSDDIVVYVGKRYEFEPLGNVPSDSVFEKARYFMWNDVAGAAKYALKYLCG